MKLQKLSKKSNYALKALFELSRHGLSGPISSRDIASAQHIPVRFLQLILAELKHLGIVEAVRGNEGGYVLTCNPDSISIGEVIGLLERVNNQKKTIWNFRGLPGDYAFADIWNKVSNSISSLLDNTTFADLVQHDTNLRKESVINYAI